MALTPDDVRNKRFTPVRLREGYDMGEVDRFLDEVEAALEALEKENGELRTKLEAAQSGSDGSSTAIRATPSASVAPPAPEPADAATETVRDPGQDAEGTGTDAAADSATETATDTATHVGTAAATPIDAQPGTVGEASTAAARLLEIATRNADELVNEARDEADKIIGEARTRAERLEAEARTKAERVESDAQTRSKELDHETAERRDQLFGSLESERDRLAAEVEELRGFEREYRSRMRAYFENQLAALNGEAGLAGPPRPDDSDDDRDSDRLSSLLGEES
ncbi:MAG TPA: DivIVA domain-containing protein [Nocardioidaceae bacterium]|nr:DivIVA domain-containing protein [Nocardioidaceae bacterium]